MAIDPTLSSHSLRLSFRTVQSYGWHRDSAEYTGFLHEPFQTRPCTRCGAESRFGDRHLSCSGETHGQPPDSRTGDPRLHRRHVGEPAPSSGERPDLRRADDRDRIREARHGRGDFRHRAGSGHGRRERDALGRPTGLVRPGHLRPHHCRRRGPGGIRLVGGRDDGWDDRGKSRRSEGHRPVGCVRPGLLLATGPVRRGPLRHRATAEGPRGRPPRLSPDPAGRVVAGDHRSHGGRSPASGCALDDPEVPLGWPPGVTSLHLTAGSTRQVNLAPCLAGRSPMPTWPRCPAMASASRAPSRRPAAWCLSAGTASAPRRNCSAC